MNPEQTLKAIEQLSKDEGINFISACKAMQAAAAKLKNENAVKLIHQIKMQSNEAQAILSGLEL
ncbi:hypothetical protein [Maribacter dokdonensis]|nr:hypothetical protein [Maribacter dokdonensis]